MSSKELCLFVFEGGRTEQIIAQKLEEEFLGRKIAIKCVFGAEIYQLYRKMHADEAFPLDLVNLLKEREDNARLLEGYTRDSFAAVYLFFDYDAHATLADDRKIMQILDFFDNETENGLLYISYPMVEAIRHFKEYEAFKDLTVKCKGRNCLQLATCPEQKACAEEPHYKTRVNMECPALSNLNKFTRDVWKMLIHAPLCKMNFLVNHSYGFPEKLQAQRAIFEQQLDKHIRKECPKVSVLSAFPLFVLDYYGIQGTKKKLAE